MDLLLIVAKNVESGGQKTLLRSQPHHFQDMWLRPVNLLTLLSFLCFSLVFLSLLGL